MGGGNSLAPKLSRTFQIQPEDKRRSVARPASQYASCDDVWSIPLPVLLPCALENWQRIHGYGQYLPNLPFGCTFSHRQRVALGLHMVEVLTENQVLTAQWCPRKDSGEKCAQTILV